METTKQYKRGKLDSWAWPGGYPLLYTANSDDGMWSSGPLLM